MDRLGNPELYLYLVRCLSSTGAAPEVYNVVANDAEEAILLVKAHYPKMVAVEVNMGPRVHLGRTQP